MRKSKKQFEKQYVAKPRRVKKVKPSAAQHMQLLVQKIVEGVTKTFNSDEFVLYVKHKDGDGAHCIRNNASDDFICGVYSIMLQELGVQGTMFLLSQVTGNGSTPPKESQQ